MSRGRPKPQCEKVAKPQLVVHWNAEYGGRFPRVTYMCDKNCAATLRYLVGSRGYGWVEVLLEGEVWSPLVVTF